MKKLLIGMILGIAISAPSVLAFRMEKPPTFSEWNTNTFTQLNNTLLLLWYITNGRFQLDVVTVDPDGNRKGKKGEMVYFDTATDQLCVNANNAKGWVCANLT